MRSCICRVSLALLPNRVTTPLSGSWLMELLNSSLDEVIWSPEDKILREFITVIEFVWITYHRKTVSFLFIYLVMPPYINLQIRTDSNNITNSAGLSWRDFNTHSAKALHHEVVLLYHFSKLTNMTLNVLFGVFTVLKVTLKHGCSLYFAQTFCFSITLDWLSIVLVILIYDFLYNTNSLCTR